MLTKKTQSALIGTLVLAALSFPLGAMAANKLIVRNAGDTADAMVVADTGYIGSGTNAPTFAFHAVSTTDVKQAQISLQTTGRTGAAFGGGLLAYHNNAAGAIANNGDRLGYMFFGSYDGATPRNSGGLAARADGVWVSGASYPTAFIFETTPPNSVVAGTLAAARVERMRITGSGLVGIGTSSPTSQLQVVGLPVFADNTAALAGGLTAGAFYRTSTGQLMVAF